MVRFLFIMIGYKTYPCIYVLFMFIYRRQLCYTCRRTASLCPIFFGKYIPKEQNVAYEIASPHTLRLFQ